MKTELVQFYMLTKYFCSCFSDWHHPQRFRTTCGTGWGCWARWRDWRGGNWCSKGHWWIGGSGWRGWRRGARHSDKKVQLVINVSVSMVRVTCCIVLCFLIVLFFVTGLVRMKTELVQFYMLTKYFCSCFSDWHHPQRSRTTCGTGWGCWARWRDWRGGNWCSKDIDEEEGAVEEDEEEEQGIVTRNMYNFCKWQTKSCTFFNDSVWLQTQLMMKMRLMR